MVLSDQQKKAAARDNLNNLPMRVDIEDGARDTAILVIGTKYEVSGKDLKTLGIPKKSEGGGVPDEGYLNSAGDRAFMTVYGSSIVDLIKSGVNVPGGEVFLRVGNDVAQMTAEDKKAIAVDNLNQLPMRLDTDGELPILVINTGRKPERKIYGKDIRELGVEKAVDETTAKSGYVNRADTLGTISVYGLEDIMKLADAGINVPGLSEGRAKDDKGPEPFIRAITGGGPKSLLDRAGGTGTGYYGSTPGT